MYQHSILPLFLFYCLFVSSIPSSQPVSLCALHIISIFYVGSVHKYTDAQIYLGEFGLSDSLCLLLFSCQVWYSSCCDPGPFDFPKCPPSLAPAPSSLPLGRSPAPGLVIISTLPQMRFLPVYLVLVTSPLPPVIVGPLHIRNTWSSGYCFCRKPTLGCTLHPGCHHPRPVELPVLTSLLFFSLCPHLQSLK